MASIIKHGLISAQCALKRRAADLAQLRQVARFYLEDDLANLVATIATIECAIWRIGRHFYHFCAPGCLARLKTQHFLHDTDCFRE